MRMIPIGSKEDVIRPDRAQEAGGHRLLAAVDVQIPPDLAAAKLALGFIFKAAGQYHLPVPFQGSGELITAEVARRGRFHGSRVHVLHHLPITQATLLVRVIAQVFGQRKTH